MSDDPHPRLAHAAACGRCEPRDPGKVGIYACGPTVYGRIHVGNARPYVVFALLKRFLEHEGYDVTLVENITDVNDKIYDAARAAGVPSERARRGDDRGLPRRHRPAGAGPPGPRAAGERDHRRHHRPDRGADRRAATPIRPTGDVYFSVRSFDEYGKLSNRRLEDLLPADQGEPDSEQARKRDPLDFALWKAQKPDEDTAWDSPWGRGPARLAHRVLRDGGGDPRPRLRHPRRRLRPDVPAPRERDRADRGRPGQAARAPVDAQRDDPVRRGEDGQVGRQHHARSPTRSTATAATR